MPAATYELLDDVVAPGTMAHRRARLRVSAAQSAALRDVLGSFLVSRLVIWSIGMLVAAVVGFDGEQATRLDPLAYTAPFGSHLLNVILAPAGRFDSSWLLEVAQTGYANVGTPAFFPFYPALVSGLGAVLGSDLIAGVAVSSLTSIGGLYLVHRLVALDFGDDVARRTVWIMACFPMAFTLSAVYTEGLFLLLSVASIYAARRGNWGRAALAAFLAAITRSSGILLVVPLGLLYLYGPRADREPDFPPAALRPRYRIRIGAPLLLAAPLGIVAFSLYLGVTTGDAMATFSAQGEWDRTLAPLAGIVEGLTAAGQGLVDLLAGTHLQQNVVDPRAMGAMNIALLGFMVLAVWLVVKAHRRIPFAYLAYAIVGLALPLSTPALGQPLMSLPRFLMVLFPLWVTLAILAGERGTHRRVVGGSLVLLAAATGLFVAWVAAP